MSTRYPLSRFLYIYLLIGPDSPPRAARELVRFILSQEGQRIVARDGEYPIPSALVEPQLRAL